MTEDCPLIADLAESNICGCRRMVWHGKRGHTITNISLTVSQGASMPCWMRPSMRSRRSQLLEEKETGMIVHTGMSPESELEREAALRTTVNMDVEKVNMECTWSNVSRRHHLTRPNLCRVLFQWHISWTNHRLAPGQELKIYVIYCNALRDINDIMWTESVDCGNY